jgi:ankyrin repeat protein
MEEFHLAVHANKIDALEDILSNNPEIDVNAYRNNQTSLCASFCRGYVKIMARLLKHPGIDVNKVNYIGDTPGLPCATTLYTAIFCFRHDAIELLLAHPEIDVNKANIYNMKTPLILCAISTWNVTGQIKTARMLLERPEIKVNERDNRGCTALQYAIYNGFSEMVELFLNHPDIDTGQIENDGMTMSWAGATQGRYEITKLLFALSKNVVNTSIKVTRRFGDIVVALTASEVATNKRHVEIAHLIDRYEQDPRKVKYDLRIELGYNLQDSAALFALVLLISCGFLQPTGEEKEHGFFLMANGLPLEFQMLLCNRAYQEKNAIYYRKRHTKGIVSMDCKRINKINIFFCTTTKMSRAPAKEDEFYDAVDKGYLVRVKRMMVDYPFNDINALCQGETPLNCAIKNRDKEITALLLRQYSIDVNKKGKHGITPLMLANADDNIDILRLLLKHPVILVNELERERTVLGDAVYLGRQKTIELLIQYPHIDVNRAANMASTPLRLAIMKKHATALRLLCDHPKIKIDLEDYRNETPLYCAASSNYLMGVKLLLSSKKLVNVYTEANTGSYYHPEISTAASQGTEDDRKSFQDIYNLIMDYASNPDRVRASLRAELGSSEQDAADLFVLFTFINDEFLATPDITSDACRFFFIVNQLPTELQMHVCNRVYHCYFTWMKKHKEFISTELIQRAFSKNTLLNIK